MKTTSNIPPPQNLYQPKTEPGWSITRRQFVSRCAACMACSAVSLASEIPSWAAETARRKSKIRLVFCETPNDQPIWPNVGYDFAFRRNRIMDLLTRECAGVEFLPTRLMNDPNLTSSSYGAKSQVNRQFSVFVGLQDRGGQTRKEFQQAELFQRVVEFFGDIRHQRSHRLIPHLQSSDANGL